MIIVGAAGPSRHRCCLMGETISNIAMFGGSLEYKAFEISWQGLPFRLDAFPRNVTRTTPHSLALMRRDGSQIIEDRDCDDIIAKAKAYIDGLLKRQQKERPDNTPGLSASVSALYSCGWG